MELRQVLQTVLNYIVAPQQRLVNMVYESIDPSQLQLLISREQLAEKLTRLRKSSPETVKLPKLKIKVQLFHL